MKIRTTRIHTLFFSLVLFGSLLFGLSVLPKKVSAQYACGGQGIPYCRGFPSGACIIDFHQANVASCSTTCASLNPADPYKCLRPGAWNIPTYRFTCCSAPAAPPPAIAPNSFRCDWDQIGGFCGTPTALQNCDSGCTVPASNFCESTQSSPVNCLGVMDQPCSCPPPGGGGDIIDWYQLQQVASPRFILGTTIGDILNVALTYIYSGAGLILVIFLLYGGFTLMTSRGDPNGVAKGKSIITLALIGFVVVFTSYWIVQFVGEFLDIQAIKNIF